MGNTSSSTSSSPPSPPPPTTSTSTTSSCPVKGSNDSFECPVKGEEKYKNPNQYNVYSQKIDPTNQMPIQPNQQPAPNQIINLSTDRVKSGIPKGGTDQDTWTYPSPQMFWNALVRKGKSEDSNEKDMDVVVAIHNNMNENTWKQVIAWEHLHEISKDNGREPKLLRFQGRPHDLSPKARLKLLFGHPAPFDRHDWIVDRGGKEVRYVIDYYHDESEVTADKTPELTDLHSIKSIKVDVRPAFDSIDSFIDRLIRMPLYILRNPNQSIYNPPPFFAPKKMITAETKKVSELNAKWTLIQEKCANDKKNLTECTARGDCEAAALALQKCTGSIICPNYVKELEEIMSKEPVDQEKLEEAYDKMTDSIQAFAIECKNRK
mmetsp:Transcript_23708/g.24322  ORF Transcript_23708/g.24322 Transcript_23708/m.24322 type:complete len:377 (+) Transcript_23708:21-1151(+)